MQPDKRIEFRIGIHFGDIMIEDSRTASASPTNDAYRQVRGKIDVNFQDSGERGLKNIARPVRVYQLRPEAPTTPRKATSDLALPDKPSIAVLAFQNMSGDSEQEFFADGIAEDIITALSKAHSPMHPQRCDAALPHGPEPQSAFECAHILEPKRSSPQPRFAPAGLAYALLQSNPAKTNAHQ
jgi:hypothetical protein